MKIKRLATTLFLLCYSILGFSEIESNIDTLLYQAEQAFVEGDYGLSVQLNLQALKIAEKKEDCVYEAIANYRVARNYIHIGIQKNEFEEATAQYKLAVKKAETCQLDSIIRKGLNSLAGIYLQLKNVDSAAYYFNELLPLMNDAPLSEASRFYSMFSAFELEHRSNFQEALQLAKKATQFAQKANDNTMLAFAYIRTGACYRLQQNEKTAYSYFQKAYQIHQKTNNREGQLFSLSLIRKYFIDINDAKKVEELMNQQMRVKDSLYNAKSAEQIANYKTLYETEQKEADLKATALQLQNEQQRSFYMMMIGVTLFLLMLVSGLFWYNRYQTRQQLALIETKEKERNRIARELHDNVGSTVSFIVSKLDGIIYRMKDEVQKERLDNVKNAAQQAMLNLRETLWTLNNPNITNTELVDKLKAYIKRYSLIENQISEDLNIEQEIPNEAVLAIYRCVQEIINNANKHSQASLITIDFKTSIEQPFFIRIQDNGIGYEETEKAESYGLRNIRSRLAEIGAKLKMESNPNEGTRIEITYQ